jgi:hypothetical protein
MRIDPHAADWVLHLVLTDWFAARAAGMMPRSIRLRRLRAVLVVVSRIAAFRAAVVVMAVVRIH